MNNNENEFTVTKIEKYSEEMSVNDKETIVNALAIGAHATIIVGYLALMSNGYSPSAAIPMMACSAGMGILSLANIVKHLGKKAKLNEELVNEVAQQLQNNSQEIKNKGKSR